MRLRDVEQGRARLVRLRDRFAVFHEVWRDLDGSMWYVDVLEDGTAVTWCIPWDHDAA